MVSAFASINEVNKRRARLVLRWMTVSGFNSRCGTFIAVCDQPPRSTQPGHPFVGKRNEYQPKGGDALWLGSKGSYGLCVHGWQVKLCDPLVTHGPYLSALKIKSLYIKRYINSAVYCSFYTPDDRTTDIGASANEITKKNYTSYVSKDEYSVSRSVNNRCGR